MLRQFCSAAAAVVLSAAVLAGCGDDGITLPDERSAAAIEIEGGDDQTAAVGAPLPLPVEALVTDAEGLPVVDQRVEFTVSGGGSASPGAVQTDDSGIAATQWVLGTTAGVQTLTARPVGNGAAVVSASAEATATAGPAVSIAAVSGGSQTAVAGTALGNPLVVQVEDEFGNGVPGVLVTWTAVGGGSVSEAETTTDAEGLAGITRTLGGSTGEQGTEAAAEGLEGSPVTFTATATVGAAGRLSIERQPSSTAQSGSPFGTQPQIQLRDAANNPVSQSGVAIQAELASGPAGSSLIGTNIAATNSSGLATFSNLGITGPAGQYTIVFSGAQSSLTGVTSSTITIAAGAPSALRFDAQPQNTTSGATMQAVRVELVDAQGNRVTGSSRTVTLTLQPSSGGLSGTTSVATTSGVATFSNLSVANAGTYRLSATASGVSGALSDQFTVSPGVATQLAFITQPTTVDAGEPITPAVRVEVRDASGNLVSSYSGVVTIAIGNNPASGTLSGTRSVNASGGIATFSDLEIDRAGSGYTLTASASGLSGATSSSFNVSAGSGSTIEKIAGDNQSAPVNTVVPIDPRVRITDANGNPVSGVTVTFAVASGGGAVTSGSTATTNSAGEAAVGAWRLGTTAGTNTLTATATGVGSVTFTATATAGAGSELEFTTAPPGSVASGAIISPGPVVQIVDAEGNPVSTSGVPITMAISSGATLGGSSLTVNTDANGRAAFVGVTASGPVGDYTLSFTGQGTPLTAPISITPGAPTAAQSSIELSPSSITSGGSTTVTVTARDAAGNPVSGVSVTLSVAPGPDAFGNASLTTASDGTASTTFTANATGTQTITATITGSGGPVQVSADLDVQASGTTTTIIGHAPSPSVVGEEVLVQFEVTAPSGTPTGTVNVTSTEGAECQGSTASGECTLTFSAAGTWTITAAYQGGGAFSGSSGSTSHQVDPAPSEVTITGFTPDPATAGESVTVQFGVASAFGSPAGDVTITTLGPSTAPAAGGTCEASVAVGQCSLAFAAAGEWLVIATYGGSATFAEDEATAQLMVQDPPAEGAPASIEVRQQPSSTARSGQAFTQQPEIRVRDITGRSLGGVPVNVALGSGSGSLGGRTSDVTRPNGVGSWDDLRITGTGAHTLRFTAGSVVASSSTIIVTP